MKEIACSVCGKVYPITPEYFPWDKKHNCRAAKKCKDCYNAHTRKVYAEHPERKAKYRLEHRDDLNKKKHEYYLKNKEKWNARSKKYYEENKDRLHACTNQWRKNHPEKVKQYTRKRYEKNREHMLFVAQRWKNNNRDRVNIKWQQREAKKKALKATLTKDQWESIKREFGYCCAYCGEKKSLTQDHFVPISKNGEYTTNNIIPACRSCNCSKLNRDFFEWYPTMKFYSKKREKHILDFLKYDNGIQQLEFEEVKMLTETKA